MQIKTFAIPGPVLITPTRHGDGRGWFIEAFKADWFRTTVADVGFIQDNQSFSAQTGTVRGLHCQTGASAQGKLVRCLRGAIFDVAVDVRPGSATYGQWAAATLTPENAEQLWVPEGFLHGFCTLTPDTEVFYKVTAPYDPAAEFGVAFDDADIAIDWPVKRAEAVLSDKDRVLPPLRAVAEA